MAPKKGLINLTTRCARDAEDTEIIIFKRIRRREFYLIYKINYTESFYCL